ncbi:MAG: hypothetical protein K2O28_04795 [Clostridia bacterium]|nr:hypothetical protein [Clostridia bacterium]
MKKGMKGNSLKDKTTTLTQSGFITSAVAFITVAIVSLITFVCNLCALCQFTPQGGNFIKDLGSVIVSAISFVSSVIGSWRSIAKLVNDSFNRQFLEDPTYKEETKETIIKAPDSQLEENGYEWCEYNKAHYLCSKKVDAALAEAFPAKKGDKINNRQKDILLRVSPKIQPLSSDQSEALYQMVKQKRASGKNIFNSKLVRLRTDMFTKEVLSPENAENTDNFIKHTTVNHNDKLKLADIGMIEVEKTDYYSNMTSNDMIYKRLFKYDHSSIYYGKDMTVNGKALYNLSQSPAANIIGVTTLAITSDGKMVINKQDNNNDVNNDCFVPSGSGSADFDDLKKCRKLEKKTNTSTYADTLENICKSYKPLNLWKSWTAYKTAVKNEIKNIKATNTVSESHLKKSLKKLKKNYENGIKDKKEYKQLKRYRKELRKYTCSFRNFITYGMVRELVEESHVCKTTKHKIDPFTMKNYMDRTEICGYIRILDRGGKPDFFGITYLDYNEKQLKEKFLSIGLEIAKKELVQHGAMTDYGEVHSQLYIPQENLLTCEKFEDLFPKSIDEKTGKEKEIKISLQLHYLLTILKNKLQSKEMAASTDNNQDGKDN